MFQQVPPFAVRRFSPISVNRAYHPVLHQDVSVRCFIAQGRAGDRCFSLSQLPGGLLSSYTSPPQHRPFTGVRLGDDEVFPFPRGHISDYHMGRNLGQYLAFLGRGPCDLWQCTCPWVLEIKRMVMTFHKHTAFRHLFNKAHPAQPKIH